jgi:hypothetical protein
VPSAPGHARVDTRLTVPALLNKRLLGDTGKLATTMLGTGVEDAKNAATVSKWQRHIACG